jgi:hypothetical protein
MLFPTGTATVCIPLIPHNPTFPCRIPRARLLHPTYEMRQLGKRLFSRFVGFHYVSPNLQISRYGVGLSKLCRLGEASQYHSIPDLPHIIQTATRPLVSSTFSVTQRSWYPPKYPTYANSGCLSSNHVSTSSFSSFANAISSSASFFVTLPT